MKTRMRKRAATAERRGKRTPPDKILTGPGARRALLFRTAGVLFGLLVALAIVEIGLLATGQPRFLKPHADVAQFEPIDDPDAPFPVYTNRRSERMRFVYETNPRGYFGPDNEVEHSTNSQGFRGTEFRTGKTPGVARIAVLGDSVAFGEGVRDEHTYAERTAALLNAAAKGAGAQRYESFNFGVGGYNTQLAQYAFKRFALPAHPDIVVVNFTLNDAEPPLFVFDEQSGQVKRRPREENVPEGQGDPEPPDTPLFALRTGRLVWKALATRARTDAVIGYYNSLYHSDSAAWAANRQALRGILGECSRRGIPCHVVCLPVLYRLDDTYPFAPVHAEVGRIVTEAGGNYIDLLPLLKGRDPAGLQVHPTDQHPNEVVHAIAAQAVADAIAAR